MCNRGGVGVMCDVHAAVEEKGKREERRDVGKISG